MIKIVKQVRRGDADIILPQPNKYRVIEKGNSFTLSGANFFDGESSNSAVASLKIANGSATVTGNKAGCVVIGVGSKSGIVALYNYQISDSQLISEYVLAQGGEIYFAEDGVTKSSPVSTVPKKAIDTIIWESFDPEVAEVMPNGSIKSVGRGATIIRGGFIDIWGVEREISLLVGVESPLGKNDLSTLLELIQKGEIILGEVPSQYTPESLNHLETAKENGIDVVNSENATINSILEAIKDLLDALTGLTRKPCNGANILQGDDGDYYKEVGHPPHVYEVVNPDGSSKYEPPRYVYAPDDNPGNGKDRPAKNKNDSFWVEDPAGSNIYKKVYKDGNLRDTPAIWGGEDGIFGTGDDKKVIGFPDGSYWRHMGQNVWKKVDKNKLDPLTGGGPDGDPTTDPVMKIYDNTAQDGKYYVGPLGSGDDIYYYGDNPVNGNGKLDSTENSLENTDTKFYKDKDGNFTTTKPPLPIKDTPESVEGGTLSPSQTGDSAAWVEIARNGDYSLIVRTHFINIYNGYYNDPAWQYTSFGSSAEYSSSLVRKFINAWWKGTGAGVTDKLPTNARIRKFTVENNAIDRIGTGSSSTGGLTNGFSQPTDIFIPSGSLDVAFALSFTESANFASKSYSTNGSGAFNDSSAAASSNFEKIDLSAGYGYGLWLRSPGEIKDTVGAIAHTGSAFQFSFSSSSTNRGLIFPAMWVKTTIFEA